MKSYNFTCGWLYIEPFVYIRLLKDKTLLYNTLNGNRLIFNSENELKFLLQLNENNRVIKVSQDELTDSCLLAFIDKIRGSFMGDILKANNKSIPPFLLNHPPNHKENLLTLRNADTNEMPSNLYSYLKEINIYINNTPSSNEYYKQFFGFVEKNSNCSCEISAKSLKQFLGNIGQKNSLRINIAGFDLLDFLEKHDFNVYFEQSNASVNLYFSFSELLKHEVSIFERTDSFSIKVIVMQSNLNLLIQFFKSNEQYFGKIEWQFIIEEVSFYNQVEALIEKYEIEDYKYIPYFNNNIDFFNEYVLLNEDDIFSQEYKIDSLMQNRILNTAYFGKITVLSNGYVYSNLHFPAIGNIENDPLLVVLHNAVKDDHSWFMCRCDMEYCQNCLYADFCPPINDYNFVAHKINLCSFSNDS